MLGPRLLAALCGALLCASGLFAFSGDFCDSSQCLNGGTCVLGEDGIPFSCLCPEGFWGIICNETERGPCFPNPCHNDGECLALDELKRGDSFVPYICKCPPGFAGYHCDNVCSMPLGMETGAITDSQISASSLQLGFMGLQRWGPELARLRRTGLVNAWTASNYDRTPWIQVNLLRKMGVTGVVTQGASRTGFSEYVKTFKVAYSVNGKNFQFIQGDAGDKTFIGNLDNNGLKTNLFDVPLEVQYVRLVPTICHRSCTLRFELLGCELSGTPVGWLSSTPSPNSPKGLVEWNQSGCAGPLGMKDNTIPDKQITASSTYKTWGLNSFSWYPFYARLDKQGKFNAWTAEKNSASEWLQIDLGSEKQVTGIITQGARDFGHIQYVAAYKLAYSNNGVDWTEYSDPGTSEGKIFPGNLDNNSHKKNMFEAGFHARYVRILPVAWHNRITLRVELLGC
ncbi:lactadherin isoform X2 [Rousettus aegyptiacus]|uniref:lactadherin isoform X2 n=1 Tax=Rousettus aegyptiacus TaxID=9407 RepID=UPI000788AE2C|nr:lactadherin isoform X2 [Rousettus aegyptiacus]